MCCLRFTNLFLLFLSVVVYNICEYFFAYASFLVLPLYAVGVYTVVCIYYASILLSTCTIWPYLGTLPLFFSLCFSYKKKKNEFQVVELLVDELAMQPGYIWNGFLILKKDCKVSFPFFLVT